MLPKSNQPPYLFGRLISGRPGTVKSGRSQPLDLEYSLQALAFSATSLPHETADTRITGGTRSLNRRLLALNIEGSLSRRAIVQGAR